MIRVPSTELKNHLGQHLRTVRAGREIVVTDRDQPVARLVPYRSDPAIEEAPTVAPRDPSAPSLGAVTVRGVRMRGANSTAILRADRDRR